MATAWLELHDRRISTQRGVEVILLSFTCVARSERISAATPYELHGEISVDVSNSSPLYLTECRSARPFWFREGNRAEMTMRAEVTPSQIENIEDLRAGGNLTFLADFTVSALCGDDRDTAVLDGHQSRLWVDAATWADTLGQAGVAEHLLLVVPVPPPTADRHALEAWNQWQKARDAVLGGRWQDAVGTSRKVAELLGYGGDSDAPAAKRSKSQRWHSLGYALFRLASAANHADEVTIEMDWTRQDAVAAVAIAGGLLKAALPFGRP